MQMRMTYKEKQGLERAALAATGLVSERHAGISGIEFQMTYYRRGPDAVLMKRTLSFTPGDYAGFHLKCMEDGCTGGGFDLAPVVAGLVNSRKKSIKGKLFCHGDNHSVGHASIEYEVNIQYAKQTKEKLPSKAASKNL
ncbi:MAG: hypothetical protein A2X56_06735 [Nitrospirae bacterium GWC2_57_13]|jgi:hypothetical protein|nr:MAG: hypothetical protein A2072_07385 [Nitrospirae bacterium GWC1_57_7]OGW29993.1 MAG: hypothetical protein A2X56_06735 [Nitrospirae bacterium GWC2_57_13]HAR46432.1 hypothetical protein [Nitrospiraceae bacterium]HAS53348.1 hypothetical protein [Nitrospiraceae bacterium]